MSKSDGGAVADTLCANEGAKDCCPDPAPSGELPATPRLYQCARARRRTTARQRASMYARPGRGGEHAPNP